MPKRKNLFDTILDASESLILSYVLFMVVWWFFDKSMFWKWFFYGIGFVVMIVTIYVWRKKTRFKHIQGFLSDKELLSRLKKMNPGEFEKYIADLFVKLGYKAQAVGGSYDGGIDVIAEKDNIKHYIQCKKFIVQTVSVGAMRDFYGAIIDRLAKGKGYFITTNKFTLEAEKFAEDKPIELIDGYRLLKYIHLAENKKDHK